jgi:hypothetical protein
MRVILFILSAVTFLGLGFESATAQSADAKRLRTDQAILEAFSAYDECRATGFVRSYYDCDCVGMTVMSLRQNEKNDGKDRDQLVVDARRACVNDAGVAGYNYLYCKEYFSHNAKDIETFCQCFAREYVKSFRKDPSDRHHMMKKYTQDAFVACQET